jgi:hypothetical protein
VTGTSPCRRSTASDRVSRDLAERYWEAPPQASPLFATFLGDHRYDDRADDLSEAAEADQRAHLVATSWRRGPRPWTRSP